MARVAKSDAEKLAELLGIAPPEPQSSTESSVEISRQAEAAVLYGEGIVPFIRKDCKHCGRKFAHTPGAVAFCSDTCRAADLLKIGIAWDWFKSADKRWSVRNAIAVPPEALKLLDELTDVRDEHKCPVYNHMRDTPEHGAWCWGDTEPPEGVVLVPYADKPEPEHEPEPEPEQEHDVLDILAELGLD
jgi:hypothetical protein